MVTAYQFHGHSVSQYLWYSVPSIIPSIVPSFSPTFQGIPEPMAWPWHSARNDAWAGYGGGTLYTRSKTISPEVLERVREATAKANVPYDKYWKVEMG